ncbi:hypothetical protein HaLaN_09588 [Haematococcus lacustris]|uniref:Uncharacterized protein n=1 Tax=Haematococcus lacustris TaxID=44745 RepID=A0A699Z3P7_HAELA|nr:hypothetical protein HaLaN_09588 [Haematococcus lacustris]
MRLVMWPDIDLCRQLAKQAVSSGHSQLASEPQLNSMAAALWRECSKREEVEEQWSEQGSQWLDTSTGGQISLAETPSFLRRWQLLATMRWSRQH